MFARSNRNAILLLQVSRILVNHSVHVGLKFVFLFHSGTPDEKALAKIVISRSIELNRYIKYALDTLLSQYGGRVQLLNAPQLNNKQFFLSRILFSKSNHRYDGCIINAVAPN